MAFKDARSSTERLWPLSERDGGTAAAEPLSAPQPTPTQSVERDAATPTPLHPDWEPSPVRYSDRAMPLGTRLFGMSGTGFVMLLLVAAALFKWASPPTAIVPATLSVFDVAEPQAPPAPDTEIPPGPEQVQKEDKPKVEVVETPPPRLIQIPSASSMATPQKAEPVDDPGPPVDQTTAPQSSPMPPGSKASDAKPTWEGQVLAALNAAKRYPLEAKRNRQQGMPWVRFTMDREGRVRSVRIVRSSGFDALDREAEALPMRASPLPKPPESVKGDRVELTVPIEYFLS